MDDDQRAEQTRLALNEGLPDGSRIVAHETGWVIAEAGGCFLADPDEAEWVLGDDDEEMPPVVFETPEAAYEV